jgi:endonuclease III
VPQLRSLVFPSVYPTVFPQHEINSPRMTTPNRTALLTKIHKVLKRHYKPAAARRDQPVLESMLYAACLENARPATADAMFDKLKTSFFDWNEVRVSTVKELAEIMHDLGDPSTTATHVKNVLQSVFESEYSFDLESLKKQNLGAAIKRLQKLEGATPFIVAYTVQTGLGGHSIPVDRGTLGALFVLGAISESEAQSGNVPGMERAISKSKGQEFGSLLHQLGAEFAANPFSQPLRELLLSISPDAKDRFPKRVTKKPVEVPVVEHHDKKKPAKEKERERVTEKTKEKPAAVGKKPAHPAKKSAEPPRPVESAKKRPLGAAKARTVAKPLAKRKPR